MSIKDETWFKILPLEERIVFDAAPAPPPDTGDPGGGGGEPPPADPGDPGGDPGDPGGGGGDPPAPPTNQAPVAFGDTFDVNEVDGVSGNLLYPSGNPSDQTLFTDADFDPDGDALTIELIGPAPSEGILDLDPDGNGIQEGNFTYTPTSLEVNGLDIFSYRLNDGTDVSNTVDVFLRGSSFTLPTNLSTDPQIVQDESAGNEIVLDIDQGTFETAAADLFLAVGELANGQWELRDNSDMSTIALNINDQILLDDLLNNNFDILYTPIGIDPLPGETISTGDIGFTLISVLGSSLKRSTGAFEIEIQVEGVAVNPPPTANDDMYAVDEDNQLADNVLANDTDPDMDPLTAMLVDDVQNGTLVLNADGSFTYTPDANFNGQDSFTYQAIDDEGEPSNIATVNIDINPINDGPPNVDLNNQDPSDDYTIIGNDSILSLGLYNTELYNGPVHPSLTDPDGSVESIIITITNAKSGDSLGFNANTAAELAIVNTLLAFSDLNITTGLNGEVVWTFTENPALPIGGVPVSSVSTLLGDWISLNVTDPTDNRIIEVKLIDFDGQSDMANLTVQYPSSNEPPVANDDAYAVDEDNQLADNVLANDTDPDMDPLTAMLVDDVQNGTLVLNADGSFTYTPDANFNGQDSFVYEVSDGNGGLAQATVNIDINPINDDPIANDDNAATDEDAALNGNVLDNDTDVDGDNLMAALVSGPANGNLVLNADGSFTYTPDANYNGPDSFVYEASDGNGGMDQATVNIDINPINDDPIANNDNAATDEDAALNGNVLGNDTDVDGDNLMAALVSGPANGNLVLNADGSFTYTPDANYNGPDSFVYEASDGNGGMDQATVNIDINPINDDPIAGDDSYIVNENDVLVIDANLGVLANDNDVDGDMLSAMLVMGPLNGNLILNPDGSFTYTPDANYNGQDSFTYKADDGNGGMNEATVTIDVLQGSEDPVLKLLGFNNKIYIEQLFPIRLSPAVKLSDADSANFDGGVLTVEIGENGTENDILLIRENFLTHVDNDGNLYYLGHLVGQVSGGENLQPLQVTFNDNASAFVVARIISRVAYMNMSDDPSTEIRRVDFQVTDGDGGISNVDSKNIIFLDVNDDPEINADQNSASGDAGEVLMLGDQLGLNITDVDLDDGGLIEIQLKVKKGTLNFTETGDLETVIFSDEIDIDGERKITFVASIDEANLLLSRLTYIPKDGFTGTDTLKVKVSDLGGDGLLGGVGKDWEIFDIVIE